MASEISNTSFKERSIFDRSKTVLIINFTAMAFGIAIIAALAVYLGIKQPWNASLATQICGTGFAGLGILVGMALFAAPATDLIYK